MDIQLVGDSPGKAAVAMGPSAGELMHADSCHKPGAFSGVIGNGSFYTWVVLIL